MRSFQRRTIERTARNATPLLESSPTVLHQNATFGTQTVSQKAACPGTPSCGRGLSNDAILIADASTYLLD
jgi:hypothetical protein